MLNIRNVLSEGQVASASFPHSTWLVLLFFPLVFSQASECVSFPSWHVPRMQPSPFPSQLTLSTSTLTSSFTFLQHISWARLFSCLDSHFIMLLLYPLLLLSLHNPNRNACSKLCVASESWNGHILLMSVLSCVPWCLLPSDETIVFMVLHHLYRNCVLSPLLASFLICKAKNTYFTGLL